MNLISEIIILLFLGIIGGLASKALKMPQLVGYILGGVIFSLIFKDQNSAAISQISEIGITLLLFAIGIDFSLDKLLKVKKYVLYGGLLQVALTIVFSYLIFQLFGYSSYKALFLGSIFSLSSTAIVVKLLEEKSELETFAGQITLGWLVVQDIAVVILIILLSTFASSELNPTLLFESLFKSLILILLALVVGRKIIPRILLTLSKHGSRDILIISSFAFALFFAYVAEQFGISPTLGAFLAGLMISESVYTHEIITEIKPLQTIFSMLFFITIGTLFSVEFLFANFFVILLILVIGLLIKSIIILTINHFLKLYLKINVSIMLYLAQIGEFAFLISRIGLNGQWIDADFANIIMSVTILSLIISPLLINNSESIYNKLVNILKSKYPTLYRKIINKSTVENFSIEELSNHIVVCGYGRVGKYVSKGLDKLNEIHVVIDINDNVIEETKRDNFIIGDAVNRDILLAAKLEKAKVCVITTPKDSDVNEIIRLCMEINPEIKIITRMRDSLTQENLANVHAIIEPEFETSIIMIEKILSLTNKRHSKIISYLRDIKSKGL
jgi:CPA2 family monovalent cation:H+ antiporter-2